MLDALLWSIGNPEGPGLDEHVTEDLPQNLRRSSRERMMRLLVISLALCFHSRDRHDLASMLDTLISLWVYLGGSHGRSYTAAWFEDDYCRMFATDEHFLSILCRVQETTMPVSVRTETTIHGKSLTDQRAKPQARHVRVFGQIGQLSQHSSPLALVHCLRV